MPIRGRSSRWRARSGARRSCNLRLRSPLMPRFEHPFQLFTLDYPESWDPMYQEETGGLILVNPGDESNAGALSLTPIAVNGQLPPAKMALELNAKQIGSVL